MVPLVGDGMVYVRVLPLNNMEADVATLDEEHA